MSTLSKPVLSVPASRSHIAYPPNDALLRRLFATAIDAVSANNAMSRRLPDPPPGRTVLLAVGKAASAMADVVLRNWTGPINGLVVTRYGHVLPDFTPGADIEVLEAGHPVPDRNSIAGALRALELARDLGPDDLVLVLVSGGGSSLWCAPPDGMTLDQKQQVTSQLLLGGASIQELNTVRIWLSSIKGGRLAATAFPARVETLIISDVVSDDPSLIASGPSTISPTSFTQFQQIVERYDVKLPARILAAAARTAPPGKDLLNPKNHYQIIAVPQDALFAAETYAQQMGFETVMLGDRIEGTAKDVARQHAKIAIEARSTGRPTVILSGGEVTVEVRNEQGVGGPNTEFLLSLAIELNGRDNIFALACDTDGYDGVGDCAGAIIRPDTLERGRMHDLDAERELENNNASHFFAALNDMVQTGPTQTNVSDFRAILVNPKLEKESNSEEAAHR